MRTASSLSHPVPSEPAPSHDACRHLAFAGGVSPWSSAGKCRCSGPSRLPERQLAPRDTEGLRAWLLLEWRMR